jgi:hypothetical protein
LIVGLNVKFTMITFLEEKMSWSRCHWFDHEFLDTMTKAQSMEEEIDAAITSICGVIAQTPRDAWHHSQYQTLQTKPWCPVWPAALPHSTRVHLSFRALHTSASPASLGTLESLLCEIRVTWAQVLWQCDSQSVLGSVPGRPGAGMGEISPQYSECCVILTCECLFL